MTRYVALYCRLSPRPDGSYEGVDTQERAGRDYAGSAWPDLPIRVFADKGISAANGDHRPEYAALREAIRQGEIARLWCVEQSRLERREIEWFTLAAELDAAGISEVHTNRDGVVRVRDEVAGIKAVLAAGEVRKLTRRINDRLADIAAEGRPSGSKPFGYRHGRDEGGGKTYVIVAEQAQAIRDAADMVLGGWSLANVAGELRKRGLHGPHRVKVRDDDGEIVLDADGKAVTRPGVLTAGSVKKMISNPTVAGWRVHRGRVVGRGCWQPILDEQTWQACRAKLDQRPRRVKRSDGGTYPITEAHVGNAAGRKYLLTGGLARCGVCGKPMVGTVVKRLGKPYLLCHPNRGGKACTGILLADSEAHVLDRLWAELDKPEFLDAIGHDVHAAERDRIGAALDAITEPGGQRDQLATLWATPGELTTGEWQTARRALTENEHRLQSELAALPPAAVNVDIGQARSAWPDMTLDERRDFVRIFTDRVTINRATPGTRAFDPGRIEIAWRYR